MDVMALRDFVLGEIIKADGMFYYGPYNPAVLSGDAIVGINPSRVGRHAAVMALMRIWNQLEGDKWAAEEEALDGGQGG
jgi:hypothetical protein